ncbi:unnamed protein product [Vitrella brassicaformis CCMP3155]|uniref:Exportin-1/Importin-beta-like domain-containing protein n=1 Tax=Vitrella brassicaformis (strain CCMP3155) TaxID=1169540 RepID=A0A0G4FH72_VITBC|nr:unnamed protein product [Vitrella brassicaformis CCMP3155]|eukprot:CEM12858.1 unnamed protein product [Vitrella brassicaformis CCMP3155]
MDASVRSVIEALRVSGQPNVSHADRVVAEQHCTSLYDHPSACEIAHRLVTHDGSQLDAALLERVQFFGHTLFREAISRQWQRWTPEQRASVKAVLLSYPTQLPADRLRSPIVRQKCAVALAEVARREWPQCWQELMPSLLNAGRTSAAHASIVMGVIRELAQECSDESTRGLPQRRRLEIVSGLQQACNDIFNTIGGYLTSLGQEGGEALLRAALEVFRDLSQVVSVSRLVELQVDEFLSSNLGKSDACRKTALQTFSTLASEVGRRKNKNRPANDMGLEHLNRLTIKIAGLAHAALPPPPPAPYTAEMHEVAMQVAYIVSEFLETSGDVLLQRLPAHTIAVLWRHGVVRLMRHPSMDLVAAVLHGAAMFIKQLGPRAQLPDWFLAEEFSSLLLVRIFRLGDPSLLAPMKELLGSEGLRAIDAVATDLTSTATGAGSDVPLRVDAHGISWTERVAQQVESEEMDTETDEGATSNVSIGAVFVDKYGKIKNACGHALRSTAALSQEICGK